MSKIKEHVQRTSITFRFTNFSLYIERVDVVDTASRLTMFQSELCVRNYSEKKRRISIFYKYVFFPCYEITYNILHATQHIFKGYIRKMKKRKKVQQEVQ